MRPKRLEKLIIQQLEVHVMSDQSGMPYSVYSPTFDTTIELRPRGNGRWGICSGELPGIVSTQDIPWQVRAREMVLDRYGLKYDAETGEAWAEVPEEDLPCAVFTVLMATCACVEFCGLAQIMIDSREEDDEV